MEEKKIRFLSWWKICLLPTPVQSPVSEAFLLLPDFESLALLFYHTIHLIVSSYHADAIDHLSVWHAELTNRSPWSPEPHQVSVLPSHCNQLLEYQCFCYVFVVRPPCHYSRFRLVLHLH
eukprot:scpid27972/ scgid30677/ 